MMLREKIMFDFGWGWFFFASKKSEWNPEPINGIVMVGISLQKMVPLWQRRRADRNEDPRRAEVRPAPADRIGSAGNAPRLPTPSPPRRTSPINSPGPTYSTWRRVASSLQLETENELAASVTRLLSAKLWKILLIAFLFFGGGQKIMGSPSEKLLGINGGCERAPVLRCEGRVLDAHHICPSLYRPVAIPRCRG